MLSVEQSECPQGDGSTVHIVCLQYRISLKINQHLLSDWGPMGVRPSWGWSKENLQSLGDRRPLMGMVQPSAHLQRGCTDYSWSHLLLPARAGNASNFKLFVTSLSIPIQIFLLLYQSEWQKTVLSTRPYSLNSLLTSFTPTVHINPKSVHYTSIV